MHFALIQFAAAGESTGIPVQYIAGVLLLFAGQLTEVIVFAVSG